MYKEGKAKIRESGKAFLNPLGKASRDLSVAYVKLLAQKGSRLIDTTAATGIRAIRYSLESKIKNLTALDINNTAYRQLRSNLLLNKVKATALNTSIQSFSNMTEDRFDFIDLDPFGGITPYIFDLLKIAKGGARLMATATDTAVLCGADSKACMRLYGSKPVHNEISHEGGIRVMIGYIASVAAQFGIGIDVEMSVSYMHYMRTFVKLQHGAKSAYETIAKLGYLKYCDKCKYREIEYAFVQKDSQCPNCKTRLPAYGRMWLGRIKDNEIVRKLDATLQKDPDKIEAAELVKMINSELDNLFYYHIPTLTKTLKVSAISPYAVATRLQESGFKTSFTHMKDSSIKSDADLNDIVSILKKLSK